MHESLASSQKAVLHWPEPKQLTTVPAEHMPDWHASTPLQNNESSQSLSIEHSGSGFIACTKTSSIAQLSHVLPLWLSCLHLNIVEDVLAPAGMSSWIREKEV